MKIARLNSVRPVQNITELFNSTSSGPSGQVLTATGSNSASVAWGSNVAIITSNSSNTLVGPYVNFASGSGIAFAAASNTLTISSTVTSGGGGGGGGSGVLTHAYVGYNTIGGTTENIVSQRQYMKKVTLANDCLVSSIGVYLKQVTANSVIGLTVGVLSDNAGSPELVIATGANDTTSNSGFYATNTGAAGAARWIHLPVGVWLTAGDYWLAFCSEPGGTHQVYYDSGSDRYYTNNDNRITDSGWTAVTTSSNKYSIRASTIR